MVMLSRVAVAVCLMTIVEISEQNHNSLQIPKNVWKELQKCESNADFINRFVSKKPPEGKELEPIDQLLFTNDTETGSFNQEGVETIAGLLADTDSCSPRYMTVNTPIPADGSYIYWPTCTKIQRCGGCCGSEMLVCAPTMTDMQSIQVLQVRYTYDGDFEYSGLEMIELERHLECDCHCRIQAHHCNSQRHDYDEQSCSCRCRNAADATSCPSHKKWDENECACICPKIFNCLNDEYFSFNTCSCQRGTPFTPEVPSVNPCAGRTCRVGYHAVQTGSTCSCKIITVLADRLVRSLESSGAVRGKPWSKKSRHLSPWED